jgi:hypothetical protein
MARQAKKVADEEIENKQQVGASAAYCSWFWFGGFTFSMLAVAIHLCVLPYADLTILSVNCIAGILFASALSMIFLKEKWITKYDLTSLIFIIFGCGMIVSLSDKTQIKFDANGIKSMLMSVKTIVFLTSCCLIIVVDYFVLKYMLKTLREFEVDALKYDAKIIAKAKRENRQVSTDLLVFPEDYDPNNETGSTNSENDEELQTDQDVVATLTTDNMRTDHLLVKVLVSIPVEKM